ncbi:TPA: DUF2591 family protein [Klebsiella pneumoniae]|nr:DUF2591 family protein [Klebsiella pneumoniae]
MDYSKLSDFEINRRVFSLVMNGRDWNRQGSEVFDFCNNPDDAWPIILSNRISMIWDCSEDANSEWWNAVDQFDECRIQYQSNPLRAAMIVFLMMQESK